MFKNCSWCASHIVLFVMLVCMVALMLGSALHESAIMDELAHIPAGYGYVKYLDFRLNPEHPPLVKALSAAPLLFMHLQFPLSYASWASDLNGQWDAGRQFLYEVNDMRADEILLMSRLLPIILTALLVVLVYAWSQKIMGFWWALFPAFLTAFSPSFLAHGHYVTTDIAASLGFMLGLLGFWLVSKEMTWKRIVYAGLLFGTAQLLKFSLVLLVPLYICFFAAMWVARSHQQGYPLFSRESWNYAWQIVRTLIGVFVVGYALVWLVYILFTWNYPISKQVSGTTTLLTDLRNQGSIFAQITVWLAGIPILRGIGHYMLGVLMVAQRSAGGNSAYFLGADGNGGWWYYFPVVYLLKETLPVLIIIGSAILFWIWRFFKGGFAGFWRRVSGYVWNHTALFVMLVFFVFYWAYSMKSPLNIGFRHILPTLPFLYILCASSVKKWIQGNGNEENSSLGQRIASISKKALKHSYFIVLSGWLIAEVLVGYPYFISYFNEIGGGVWGGYAHVVDSNYDWGQDLKRLSEFVQKEKISNIAVDYFGGGHVPYYIPQATLWDETKGDPLSENVEWLAVSVNELQYDLHATELQGAEYTNRHYRWISHPYEPYARVGTSIFVYRLR